MDELTLLADLHKAGLRQGPGSPDVTRRAMVLAGLDGSRPLEIADIGCGTGAASLELARMLDARITAVDFLPSFLDVLRQRAQAQGLGRIITLEASMDALPFTDASFDVIWSEGAVYNMGFEAGIAAWKRFLKPGGKLCVLELSAPTGKLTGAFYRLYAGKVIPAVGRLLSHDTRAYSYLPESIAAVPSGGAMLSMINDAGFVRARYRRFTFGVCTLYTAYKPL